MTLYRVNVMRLVDGVRIPYMYEYPVIKTTPCGAWIELALGERRFVNFQARKRYACPTKADAIESFRARKRRQMAILTAQLKDAQRCLDAVEADVDRLCATI